MPGPRILGPLPFQEEKRRQRELDKQRREAERLAALSDKQRREEEQQRAKQQFLGFFQPKPRSAEASKPVSAPLDPETPATLASPLRFQPFFVDKHTTVAPTRHRTEPLNVANFDSQLSSASDDIMVRFFAHAQISPDVQQQEPSLAAWIRSVRTPLQVLKPALRQDEVIDLTADDNSVVVPPQPAKLRLRGLDRMKLLQFTEDLRPAYYGTHHKTSASISGRRPCSLCARCHEIIHAIADAKETNLLDYEYDSEAEWEDPGDGEDLKSDDDEDDEDACDKCAAVVQCRPLIHSCRPAKTAEDDEEENDGFIVPHGYLSDDEGVDGEEDGENIEHVVNKDGKRQGPVAQQVVRPPIAIGPLWGADASAHPRLGKFRFVALLPTPIDINMIIAPPALADAPPASEAKAAKTLAPELLAGAKMCSALLPHVRQILSGPSTAKTTVSTRLWPTSSRRTRSREPARILSRSAHDAACQCIQAPRRRPSAKSACVRSARRTRSTSAL